MHECIIYSLQFLRASLAAMDTSCTIAVHSSEGVSSPDQPQPSSPTSTDGWGELENGLLHEDHDSDKEGWDELDPIMEQTPAPLASIQAAQKRPMVQPQSQGLFSSVSIFS